MNKLVVFSNNGLANEYPLEGPELVIGRDPECQIRLNNPQVSRRHARLLIEGERVMVSDLGSRNGTFVAGRRIESPTPLHDELVAIGHHKLFLARADGAPMHAGELLAEPAADRALELPETQEIHGFTNAWPPEPPALPERKGGDGRGAAA
jgi:pSer/pThr/pTyr-binding forkhead associated (FHA) protein